MLKTSSADPWCVARVTVLEAVYLHKKRQEAVPSVCIYTRMLARMPAGGALQQLQAKEKQRLETGQPKPGPGFSLFFLSFCMSHIVAVRHFPIISVGGESA